MRMIKILSGKIVLCLLLIGCTGNRKDEFIQKNIEFAKHQIEYTINELPDCKQIPRTTTDDNHLKTVDIYSWTSGFFAGSLWYMYDLSKDEKWKNEAIRWTEVLDTIQY